MLRPDHPARPALLWAALAVMIVAAGITPWWPILDALPFDDAERWVAAGHPSNPEWSTWVFGSRHFVGWRPVAALTYTLDGVFGWDPRIYHLTDVGLHVAVAIALFAAYRALTGDRSGWGLLAPAVLLLHPASEHVVPHLARRSYSLSCVFVLVGVVALARAASTTTRSGVYATVAAALFAAALATNEVAAVPVALLPLVAAHLLPDAERTWPRVGALLAPTVGAGLALVAARQAVLGELVGGYDKHYLAFTVDGASRYSQSANPPYAEILRSALSFVPFPPSAAGQPPLLLESPVGWAGAGLVLAFYGWFVCVRPLRHPRDPSERLQLALAVWVLVYAALYALTGNWFWRQGYPMVMPLAVLVAATARRAWAAPWRWPALGPQALLLASIAWHSPATRGPALRPLGNTVWLGDVVRAVVNTATELDGPRVVWLVLPTPERDVQMVRAWAQRLSASDLTFRALIVAEPARPVAAPLLVVDGEVLRLPRGARWAEVAATQLADEFGDRGRSLPLAALDNGRAPGVVIGRSPEGWVSVEVGE